LKAEYETGCPPSSTIQWEPSRWRRSISARELAREGKPFVHIDGGLHSTAADYAKFIQLFLNDGRAPNGKRLLSEATVALQQLGYKPAEAARMARDAVAAGDDAAAIIRKALQSALR